MPRRILVAGAALTVLGSLALVPLSASASVTSFTWSGTAAASGKPGWSVGRNWAGGHAPASGSTAALDFPVLTCAACAQSKNNLSSLTVSNLSMEVAGVPSGGSGSSYSITGKSITLDGLSVSSSWASGDTMPSQYLSLPLHLGGPQSWTVSLEQGLNFDLGTVSGATDSLNVSLPVSTGSGGFLGFESPFNVGTLNFTTPSGSSGTTILVPVKSLNGSSKQPVTLSNVGLFATGPFGATTPTQATVTYGPLTVEGNQAQLGNGGGMGPYGIDKVEGNATLTSSTSLSLWSIEPGTGTSPVAGVDYPQLAATGTAALGSANLTVWAGCNQPLGETYTIVKGGAGVTGTFVGLANGAIFQALPDNEASCGVAGATAPYVKIHYGAKAVTLKVVAPPPAAEMAHQDVHVPAQLVETGGLIHRM